MRSAWGCLVGAVVVGGTFAPAFSVHGQTAPELPDPSVMRAIAQEALASPSTPRLLQVLTDRFGGRLPASPQYRAATEWAAQTLREFGATRVWKEAWPYGPGWSNTRSYAQVVEPVSFPVVAYPLAWTPGTDGLTHGPVVLVDRDDATQRERLSGSLRGKFVLTEPPRRDTTRRSWDHLGPLTDAEILDLEAGRPYWESWPTQPPATDHREVISGGFRQFLLDEGVAGWIGTDRGAGRGVQVSCCSPRWPQLPVMVTLVPDDYARIHRLVEAGEEVELELEIRNEFDPDHNMAENVLAEIRGSAIPDEVVLLGAHIDSWHAGSGASDNGAGVVIVMEALRILSEVGVPLRRTVRVGLWGMEENPYPDGAMTHLFRNYVRWAGSSESVPTRKRPKYDKVSAYFNVDHGSGRIRGVYSNGNDEALELIREWLRHLEGLGASTASRHVLTGSDHDVFNAFEIPGFMFIQEPTGRPGPGVYHGNGDTFDAVDLDGLRQAAAVVASVAYLAANDPRTVPRAPTDVADGDPEIEEAIEARDLAELAGEYMDASGIILVHEVDGILIMSRPDRMSRWELFQYGPSSFSTGVGQVEFTTEDGRVAGLTYTNAGGSRELRRQR